MKINDESAIARKYTVIVICGTIILKKGWEKILTMFRKECDS